MDQFNQDIGSSGPLLVDVPGATPSQLIVAMDKGGYAYLLNRTNLGGISAPIDSFVASGSGILNAAVTYRNYPRHLCCLSTRSGHGARCFGNYCY